MTSDRSVWSASFERVSLPLRASGAEMIATCRSITWTEIVNEAGVERPGHLVVTLRGHVAGLVESRGGAAAGVLDLPQGQDRRLARSEDRGACVHAEHPHVGDRDRAVGEIGGRGLAGPCRLGELAQRPGHVKSRDQLMDAAYGEHIYVDDRTIDSHIKRLRKKFKAVDSEFGQIETLYGVGYRYRDR